MAGLPSGRAGRLLAALLAVLVVLILWIGVAAPVIDWYGARAARLQALRERAAREAALIETLPQLKQAAEAASKTPTQAVLTGSTDAIAGAALQEQVQAMAGSASAQLTSIETLAAEQAGNYRRIGVRVDLSAQLPVIVQLLRAIEEAEPRMLVDDIRLTGTPLPGAASALPLECVFTVYAFRVGTGSGAEAAP